MVRDCTITAGVKRAQQTLFREAERLGITHKVIHYDTGGDNGGLSLSAIGQYARGESAMGLPVLVKLFGVVPTELLSLLLPDGFVIVSAKVAVDHDAAAEAAGEYLAVKQAAHHPDSPAGREIAPEEDEALRIKLAAVQGGVR